jgi:ankyrin repeat protein
MMMQDGSAMLIACESGHLPVCEWLFEKGAAAHVTKADSYGDSPMLAACLGCHLPVCKWLYDHGAAKDITKANDDGETPMLTASWEGNLPVCKWLYEHGAAKDTTKADKNGMTPMHMACEGGHLSVCKARTPPRRQTRTTIRPCTWRAAAATCPCASGSTRRRARPRTSPTWPT